MMGWLRDAEEHMWRYWTIQLYINSLHLASLRAWEKNYLYILAPNRGFYVNCYPSNFNLAMYTVLEIEEYHSDIPQLKLTHSITYTLSLLISLSVSTPPPLSPSLPHSCMYSQSFIHLIRSIPRAFTSTNPLLLCTHILAHV